MWLAFGAPSAQAAELPALQGSLRYQFSWSGLSIGSMLMQAQEAGATYKVVSDIKAKGVASLFSKHKSHAEAVGNTGKDGYQPLRYDSNYHKNGEPQRISLRYNAAGDLTEDIQEPPKSDESRPDVPQAQKNGSLDPLSMFLTVRHLLAHTLAKGGRDFSVSLYDGKRLSRLEFTIVGQKSVTLFGKTTSSWEVMGKRVPIAGFKPKELKKMAQGEPPLYLYFTDDGRLMPYYGRIDGAFGVMVAYLVRECPESPECPLPE